MNSIYELLPVLSEKRTQEMPCGYFPDRLSKDEITSTKWLNNFSDFLNYEFTNHTSFTELQLYDVLMQKGYRRCGGVFYHTKCKGCKECIPIRIKPSDFLISKSQKKVLRNNEDLVIKIEKNPANFVSDEKAFLFREYDFYHNHKTKLSLQEAKESLFNMNTGYKGIWNMEYYFQNQLIAVAILDYTQSYDGKLSGLSSNYFYYDISPSVLKRSIGVYSVLKEIELCQKEGFEYYYLGLYLKNCRKMNYKTNYKPYELFEKGKWNKYDKNHNKLPAKKDKIPVLDPNKIIPFPYPQDNQFPGFVEITKTIPLQLLYSAYMQGVFPWFDEKSGEPVIWQSPQERFVIFPQDFHTPKSVIKFLKKSPYTYTKDKCFKTVMENCGSIKRDGQNGSWIGPKMIKAYTQFHKAGYAHSYEVWHNEKLAGGFYGVQIKDVFFGESMFTIEPDSAKSAFCMFAKDFFDNGGKLIDCQAYTDNMARFGAKEISRDDFWLLIKKFLH